METQFTAQEARNVVDCVKSCQQTEIIQAFRTLREQITERKLFVLFEDCLNCDVLTDHLKPKNVLPVYQKFIDQAENHLLSVPFVKEQQAIKKIIFEANQERMVQHAYYQQRSIQLGTLFESATRLIDEMERMIVQLATDKGKDKNTMLAEIQFLREQLLNKKNLQAQYKPDFNETIETGSSQNQVQFYQKNDKLLKEKEEAIRNASRLSRQLMELQQLQESSRKQMDNLRQMLVDYDQMKQNYDGLLQKLAEKADDYNSVNDLLISAQEANSELSKQLGSLKLQLHELDDHMKGQEQATQFELQRVVREKEQQINEQQISLESMKEQYGQLNDQCVDLNSQLQDVRFQNQQLTKAAKSAEEEKQELVAKIDELRLHLQQNDAPDVEQANDEPQKPSKQQQIQQKLAEMQKQKQEQIDAQIRHLLAIESEAFQLITGQKATLQDTAAQLKNTYCAKQEKLLKEQTQKAVIAQQLSAMRASSASSYANGSFEVGRLDTTEQLKDTNSGAADKQSLLQKPARLPVQVKRAADQKQLKKMLQKCPLLVQQEFAALEQEIAALQQQNADLLQAANAGKQKEPENRPEDIVLQDVSCSDQNAKRQLVQLKAALDVENDEFNRACAGGRMTDTQIAEMVLRQRDLVDQFNEQLSVLAQIDVSTIDKLQAELQRFSNTKQSAENQPGTDVAVQTDMFVVKQVSRTPKTTLSTLRRSDDADAPPPQSVMVEKAQDDAVLAREQLNASQLRLSQAEEQPSQPLQRVNYQPRLSMREIADHYDTLELGYDALGNPMFIPNQYDKWDAQISAVNSMLQSKGITGVNKNGDLLRELEIKKQTVKSYYEQKKLYYNHSAVIKTLKNAENMIDSLMVISSGGQRRFYTLLGAKLVRTMGSRQQVRSLSQGARPQPAQMPQKMLSSNRLRPTQVLPSERPARSQNNALPQLNIKQ